LTQLFSVERALVHDAATGEIKTKILKEDVLWR